MPLPYVQCFGQTDDYSFDLPNRAACKTATRSGWLPIVQHQDRLKRTMKLFLPTLWHLLKDYGEEGSRLVRVTQSLGDMLLPTDEGDKYPFAKIIDIERCLLLDYEPMIAAERELGQNSEQILAKLTPRLQAYNRALKEPSKEEDQHVKAPKPGAVVRAMTRAAFGRSHQRRRTCPLSTRQLALRSR